MLNHLCVFVSAKCNDSISLCLLTLALLIFVQVTNQICPIELMLHNLLNLVGSNANRTPRSRQGVNFCPGRVIIERFVVVYELLCVAVFCVQPVL